MAASSKGAMLRGICRAYREAAAAYERAFVRGDLKAIEESLSRMQEIANAFEQGAIWAERQRAARAKEMARAP
jgi:predicted short-subunit dehydrogenase-like oxidoreductase (DUF2520 family)